MKKYISFLLVPMMIFGINSNSCFSQNNFWEVRAQCIREVKSFANSPYYSYFDNNTIEDLKNANRISNAFAVNISQFLNTCLSDIKIICEELFYDRKAKLVLREFYSNITPLIRNLKNNINNISNSIELENYIMREVFRFCIIIKEFANTIKQNLSSYNRQKYIGTPEFIERIDKLLSIEDKFIQLRLSILVSQCIDKLEQGFDDSIRYFLDGIEKIRTEYNLNFCKELSKIMTEFYRAQRGCPTLEQILPMMIDDYPTYYNLSFEEQEKIEQTVNEYKKKFEMNSVQTLKQILIKFNNIVLRGNIENDMPEIRKIVVQNIMLNVEQQKKILEALKCDIEEKILVYVKEEEAKQSLREFCAIDRFIGILDKSQKRLEKQLQFLKFGLPVQDFELNNDEDNTNLKRTNSSII